MMKPYYYWNYESHQVLFWIDNFNRLYLSVKTIDEIIGEEVFPSDLDDRHLNDIFGWRTWTEPINGYILHLYPLIIAVMSLHRAVRRGNQKAKHFLEDLISTYFVITGERFNVRDYQPTNETIFDVLPREAYQSKNKTNKTNRR